MSNSDWCEKLRDTYDQLVKCEKPKHIYHYTSLAALEKIVINREMWATHRSCLNDRRDLRYGFDACKRYVSTWADNTNDIGRRIAKEVIPELEKNEKESRNFFYSTSFTEEEDGAAQWQIYGQYGRGISIQFNFQQLELSLRNESFDENRSDFIAPRFWLNRIEYNHQLQQDGVFKLMDAVLDRWKDISAYYEEPEKKIAHFLAFQLYMLSNRTFKHHGHLYEREWKAIPNVCSDKWVQFLFSRQTVRPYLSMKFDPACISGLTIGSAVPQPFEELKEALSSFLDQHNLTNIEIKPSDILLSPPGD